MIGRETPLQVLPSGPAGSAATLSSRLWMPLSRESRPGTRIGRYDPTGAGGEGGRTGEGVIGFQGIRHA